MSAQLGCCRTRSRLDQEPRDLWLDRSPVGKACGIEVFGLAVAAINDNDLIFLGRATRVARQQLLLNARPDLRRHGRVAPA